MTKSEPFVSVLMTAYNREKYIGEAIESVLASTYTDFELIIVDDASSDNTVAIAKTYAANDNRIKIYVNERNLGDYPNRNKAASYANGRYLKYVDSDDLIEPEALDIMAMAMISNPDVALGLSTREKLVNRKDYLKLTATESYRKHFFHLGILSMGPSFAIISNEVFQREKGFLEIRNVSDTELWLRIASRNNIIQFSDSLIKWREHEHQEFRIAPEYYLANNYKILYEKLMSKDCPLTKPEVDIILKKEKKMIVGAVIKFGIKKFKPLTAYKYLKNQNLTLADLFVVFKK